MPAATLLRLISLWTVWSSRSQTSWVQLSAPLPRFTRAPCCGVRGFRATLDARPRRCKREIVWQHDLPHVPLPDASRLLSLHTDRWATLGERLRQLGLTKEQVGEITRIGAQLPDPTREPMRRWHLRRLDTPVAYAMRMLVFADSVTEDEASSPSARSRSTTSSRPASSSDKQTAGSSRPSTSLSSTSSTSSATTSFTGERQ